MYINHTIGNNLNLSRTTSDLDTFLMDVNQDSVTVDQKCVPQEGLSNTDYKLNASLSSNWQSMSQDSCRSSGIKSRRSRSAFTRLPQVATMNYASVDSSHCDSSHCGMSGSDTLRLPSIVSSSKRIASSYSEIRKKELARLSREKHKYSTLGKKASGLSPLIRYKCKRGSMELTTENQRSANRHYTSLDVCSNTQKILEQIRYRSEPQCSRQNSEYIHNTLDKSDPVPGKFRPYNHGVNDTTEEFNMYNNL